MNSSSTFYLGIDTSCYTTSIAVVSNGCVNVDKRIMLPVPQGSRGLRQQDAVFHHTKNFKTIFKECDIAAQSIAAVAYSAQPCPAKDSYMPVFCVGESFAAACACMQDAGAYALTHQHGHIYAAFFGNDIKDGTYGTFHVSGGTLDILRVDIGGTIRSIETIGGSRDITCGQLIDRVGVAAGLPFPSGKEMERIYQPGSTVLSVTVDGMYANLSGAEIQAMRMLQSGTDACHVCSSVIDCVAETIRRLIINTIKETSLHKFIFTGGVICNNIVREAVMQTCEEQGCVCILAQKPYCSDNACGLALAAQMINERKKWD